jgi:hypothetical protein
MNTDEEAANPFLSVFIGASSVAKSLLSDFRKKLRLAHDQHSEFFSFVQFAARGFASEDEGGFFADASRGLAAESGNQLFDLVTVEVL